jgi:hypothetical protein
MMTIVVGKAKADKLDKSDGLLWGYIHDGRVEQELRALQLCEEAGVGSGAFGLEDAQLFQDHLIDYRILIVSESSNKTKSYNVLFDGSPNSQKCRIVLLYHNKHFDVLFSMTAFLNRSQFCWC